MSSINTFATNEDWEDRVKDTKRKTILAVILVIFIPILFQVYRASQLQTVKFLTIDNIQLVSPPALCHGEKLIFSYDLHTEGEGTLIRDLTLWRITPPKTMIFSDERRFILDESVDQHLREAWEIPHLYLNHETAEVEELPPGKYHRHMSITSPDNPDIGDIVYVEFEIKEKSKCKLSRSSSFHVSSLPSLALSLPSTAQPYKTVPSLRVNFKG